jgi:hypothetical protein
MSSLRALVFQAVAAFCRREWGWAQETFEIDVRKYLHSINESRKTTLVL